MKKNIKGIFFLALVVICIVLYPTVRADSGFDSSWDSGGSSWDSGSSSWDSGSHSSSEYSSDGEFDLVEFLLIMVISFIIFAVLYLVFTKIPTSTSTTVDSDLSIRTDDYIKEKLGEDFDIQAFYNEVFKIYKDVQIAWMDRDIDRVRNVLSDEMYNTYKSQVEMLKIKKQINVMENIEYRASDILNINIKDNHIKIVVRLSVRCYDYLINEETKKVLRGNKDQKNHYVYNLIFTKAINVDNKCPKCGAELDNSSSVTCPYCKWSFVKDSANFILVDKKMWEQHVEKGK